MVDSALLGDDPLISPEGGRLITATRDTDREWLGRNVKPGTSMRFDMRTGLIPIVQAPSEKVSCFCNPLHPEVRKHELDVVREIVSNYDIDGLVLDRCRFSNLNNDFSDRTRTAFEQTLHRSVTRWPQDVFAFSPTPGGDIIKGPLYKQWLEFRARIIRDLVGDIARTARSHQAQSDFRHVRWLLVSRVLQRRRELGQRQNQSALLMVHARLSTYRLRGVLRLDFHGLLLSGRHARRCPPGGIGRKGHCGVRR